MSLSVIGAGFGRTGTKSLKLALEQLGFGPCHHMSEFILDPARAPLWVRAAEGEPDWESIYEGFKSGVDVPTCIFWQELADYYPQAKVILTVRDPESWYESGQATVLSPLAQGRIGASPLGGFFAKVMAKHLGAENVNKIHDRDFMIERFQRHNAEVERTIQKDRLLVLEVSQGWEPLCGFLGVPVPSAPFPHLNTRAEMARNLDAANQILRERLGKDEGRRGPECEI
jgi:hypothetical protein